MHTSVGYLVSTWLGGTVCWIEVKVAVLCAHQYMLWNQLLMKILINVWYFKHQILTWICSEPYLKHQKLRKTLIRSRVHGMYWCAHKTATLTSIQHTVIGGSLRVQNWMQKILKSHRPISADSWPASSPYQIVQWFPTIIFCVVVASTAIKQPQVSFFVS